MLYRENWDPAKLWLFPKTAQIITATNPSYMLSLMFISLFYREVSIEDANWEKRPNSISLLREQYFHSISLKTKV